MHELRPTGDGPQSTDDLVVGYVGGGSGGWAPTLMNDLAQCPDLGGEVRLYDLDRDRAARNAEFGNRIQERDDAVGNWEYTAVDDLVAALDGADFVVLSTQDPPHETMVHDLDLPREYGIYQTVGDTVGPGGTMRAMRAVPQYREIAAAVRERCPDAWVINYTNPMTVCTRTLYEEYPDINAVGLCHEVFHVQGFFADLVAEHTEHERPPREEVDLDVTGINHFTWVTGARWRGRDLTDLLDAELAARKPLPNFEPGDMADESWFVDNQQVALDLYDTYGLLPAAGDRHLAEFVPWYLDVADPEEVHRWGIKLTTSDYRVNRWPEDDARIDAYLDGEETFEFHESGEEAVDIMLALCGLAPMETNVNVPNVGQAPDLPDGAVVETNALLTGDALTPMHGGRLPEEVRSLVARHVSNQETLVAAGFDGDVDRAFRAFLDDPLVSFDREEAADLFRDLVAAERDYLRDWDLDGASVL